MTGPAREIILTNAPLVPPPPDYSAVAGGVLDFHGIVRGHENAEAITGIDYEAHPEMAKHQLRLLVDDAFAKFPLLGVVIHHRVGFVAAAEPSLFLRVSAAHRGPAFEASQWLIEQLKLRIPIWKHPISQATGRPVEPDADETGLLPVNPPGDTSPDSVA